VFSTALITNSAKPPNQPDDEALMRDPVFTLTRTTASPSTTRSCVGYRNHHEPFTPVTCHQRLSERMMVYYTKSPTDLLISYFYQSSHESFAP